MKESMWGYMIITFGVLAISFIYFFQNVTNTNDHNYTLLKETTEAAMYDALDLASYRANGSIRMDSEKFIDSFVRRFAENANLSNEYQIDIYDINEEPPKVSLKVSSTKKGVVANEETTFDVINRIDAILETTY